MATAQYEHLRRVRLQVHAVAELGGHPVEIRQDGRTVASAPLESRGPRCTTGLCLPVPERGRGFGTLEAWVDGKRVSGIELADPDEQRARALMEIEVHCQPSVFTGAELPACGPAQPTWVEDLLGPYTVRTAYYDSAYALVTAAERPGRYGAVIDIVPERGRPLRRYRTLFRQPRDLQWWNVDLPVQLELPAELGISPQAVQDHSRVLREHLKWRLVDGFWRDDGAAPLFAGLFEARNPGSGDPGPAGDVLAQDRQWWVGLKRRQSGLDTLYAQPFVCPRPAAGPPAPVVREGTPQEAEVDPQGVARLDSLLQAWAASSDEGFAVCIARHGVIVLHRAYGQRDGRPMTVEDPSWMASITKLLSSTLMMMLVDQGVVGLDSRVDPFLTDLGGVEVAVPLTVRHLYTHTNGLWGHWGDDLHDFEAVVAGYYPFLRVGQHHEYNGAGYSLGGKLIEAASGEALPQFFRRHLLDPLGCTHTYVTDSAGGARSVPLDIARIGQMLLNGGAYGDLRFFGKETFAQMLPVRLTQVLGPQTQTEWGIGTVWYRQDGLGEGTFGHGAASSATLRIDPQNDLVVVMTRNAAGTGFGEYHPRFLEAVAATLTHRRAG
ncbi:MAG: serine hydrolase domain-containing protein [Candidatus Latescibacterota bacterium]